MGHALCSQVTTHEGCNLSAAPQHLGLSSSFSTGPCAGTHSSEHTQEPRAAWQHPPRPPLPPALEPPQTTPSSARVPQAIPREAAHQTLPRAAPGWVGARWHPWAGNLGGAGGFSLPQHNCGGSRLPAGESGHQRSAFIACHKTAISSQASSLITQPVLSFHFITGINNEFKAWKAIKMCD